MSHINGKRIICEAPMMNTVPGADSLHPWRARQGRRSSVFSGSCAIYCYCRECPRLDAKRGGRITSWWAAPIPAGRRTTYLSINAQAGSSAGCVGVRRGQSHPFSVEAATDTAGWVDRQQPPAQRSHQHGALFDRVGRVPLRLYLLPGNNVDRSQRARLQ